MPVVQRRNLLQVNPLLLYLVEALGRAWCAVWWRQHGVSGTQFEIVGARTRLMRRLVETGVGLTTAGSAMVVLLLLIGIVAALWIASSVSRHELGWEFLVSTHWNPVTGKFGALSSIYGTVVSSLIALVIAVPLSLAIALFLVEMAPPWLSNIVGGAVELLAAIPSIIFGMWGMFVLGPFMGDYVEPQVQKYTAGLPLFDGATTGVDMLTAGLVLALMILPFITSITRDVFRMTPGVVRESAYAMGSTTWEVTRRVTIAYGLRGIVGAVFLGLGRALGETMAVTFVIGNDHHLNWSLFGSGNTIASTLANEYAEAKEPIFISALVELGLVLVGITLLIQVLAHLWLGRIAPQGGER